MKKTFSIFGIILVSVTYLSCKKDSGSSSSTGSFSFHDATFSETSGVDAGSTSGSFSYNSLTGRGVSSDSKKYAQYVFIFPGSARPTAGTYTVADASASTLAAGHVVFEVIDSIPVAGSNTYSTGGYLSTGADGATLKVSLNSAGKLSLTLSSAAASGTYYDNTIPTNTQIVSVNTTASGTFNEQ